MTQFRQQFSSLKKPIIAIFDWDDTVINSGGIYSDLFNRVMDELNVSNDVRVLRESYKHYSLKESFPVVFQEQAEIAKELYYRYLSEVDMSCVELMDGVEDVLRCFFEQKIKMLVVSNKNGSILRDEVKILGFEKYFHSVVGSNDAPRDKPWPDPALLALQGLELPQNEQIWFIGDSLVDLQCAQSINCQAVLFGQNGLEDRADALKIHYAYVPNHKELMKLYHTAQ